MKEIIIQALKSAGAVVKEKFGKDFSIGFKNGNTRDLVTEVDLSAEKIILDVLKKEFPDFGYFSEEAGQSSPDAPCVWIIDPLDGTTNFTRKIPCVSISIALVKDKEVILGAAANPLFDEIYYAEKGKGAFLNNQLIHVSSVSDLSKAFVCAEWWSRTLEYKQRGLRIFDSLAERCSKIRYLGGTVWGLTRLAQGLFDLDTRDTTLLDIAAVSLIIKEAGGLFTDERGEEIKPFDMSIKRIVAANPILHKQVLELINH